MPPQKENCDTKLLYGHMHTNMDKKRTTTGEFGGPSGRRVGGGVNDALVETQHRSASGVSGAMGNPHSPNQATAVVNIQGGVKGREGNLGKLKGKGNGKKGVGKGKSKCKAIDMSKGKEKGCGGEEKGNGGRVEEGNWDEGRVGKGTGEEERDGKEKGVENEDKGEVEDRDKGKEKEEHKESEVEDMDCEEEEEGEMDPEVEWEEVKKGWGVVVEDFVHDAAFRSTYHALVEMEWGLKELVEEMREYGLSKEIRMVVERLDVFMGLLTIGIDNYDNLAKRVYMRENKVRMINKNATDIIARQRKAMEDKDKELEKLREALKGKEKEMEDMKDYVERVNRGMVAPRPAMVERATSPRRDSHGDLRALVREVMREEMEAGKKVEKEKGVQERKDVQERRNGGVGRGSVQRPEGVREGVTRPPVIPAVITVRAAEHRTYADVLGALRKEVPRGALCADRVDVRVTPSGVARITLGGANRDTARRVADRFREVLGHGATISTPCSMETIEVAGFDLSVRETELAAEIKREWGVSATDLWVGQVRRTRGGAGRALVRLPSAVARQIRGPGLRVGWCRARAYGHESRLIQCFRCLGFGHPQRTCVASVVVLERPGCYACGKPGHLASQCGALPSCAACGLRGWETTHRMGSPQCHTYVAYTSRLVSGGVEREVESLPETGVAAAKRPPESRKRGTEIASSSAEGTLGAPPPKTIAIVPPVGGPRSGLPPEGLDPGEGVERMEEC